MQLSADGNDKRELVSEQAQKSSPEMTSSQLISAQSSEKESPLNPRNQIKRKTEEMKETGNLSTVKKK